VIRGLIGIIFGPFKGCGNRIPESDLICLREKEFANHLNRKKKK
jgi:hypothetical protein